MNLQANRCNEFSINGLYLHIYDYDGSGQYYTVKDIRKDLKARGLSKYDLYVIDQYCMLIIDGPVALYTGEYLDWDWCWTRKCNLLKRVHEKLLPSPAFG